MEIFEKAFKEIAIMLYQNIWLKFRAQEIEEQVNKTSHMYMPLFCRSLTDHTPLPRRSHCQMGNEDTLTSSGKSGKLRSGTRSSFDPSKGLLRSSFNEGT